MSNLKNILLIGKNKIILKQLKSHSYNVISANEHNFALKKDVSFDAIVINSVIFQDCDYKNLIEFLKNFECEIILIKTNANHYQNILNRIIDTKKRTTAYNKKINQFCKKLSKDIKIKIIDISNFYFAKKQKGKQCELFELEDEYYIDVSNIIINIINKKEINLKKPDFSLALSRLKKYKLTVIDKVKFDMSDNKLWNFVCHSDKSFIKKYQDIIIQISNKNTLSIKELKTIKNVVDENFYRTFEAYIFVKNKKFEEKNIKYEYIFKNKMKITFLKEILQKIALEIKIITCKNEINFSNYGYYFAKIFNKNIKKYNFTKLSPKIVDVWGSCVSRLAFNFDDDNFAVDKYYFQILPFNLEKQISYNKDMFIKNHTWQDKILKQVLDGQVISSIKNHNAKWLIIDIHALTSKKIYSYDGKIFVDFNQKVSKSLGATKVANLNDVLSNEEIEIELINFCKLIKSNYENIILIKNKWQIFYKTDDNKIMQFKDSEKNFQNNIFIERFFEVMKDNLNPYVITDVDNFYSDEKSILRNSPVHYEDDFYKSVLNKIKRICLN